MSDSSPQRPNDTNQFAVTQIVSSPAYSKEERDIAFAAEVLEASALSERQLFAALANWTLHGTVPLAEHLVHSGALTPQSESQLTRRAADRLKRLIEPPSNGHQGLSADSLTKTALESLDPSGRVAKLFGISVATSGVSRNEAREHKSRFQLIRRLGQGGLGTVWLARDLKLQRYVALKEIRNAQVASQAALDRFQREAEITGRLEHPGIVPVYQLGEDLESSRAFYTMRFLGKRTMQDAIFEYHERREAGDDDPMLLRYLLTAFVSVCQAIGHAHSRKVIHRDLKPENIAIDNFGQVIVIDWGLAKVLDEGLVEEGFAEAGTVALGDVERTIAGQVLGSPLYMAPEQAAGRVDEVDQGTDVYGLGAILFAILTGYAPHEQSRVSSGSTTTRELITVIASGPTPSAQQANADVDAALAAICAKAMAKKRYARYQAASELADDVQRWMAGEPVSAYHESFTQRVGRWIQHHRRLSQMLGAAAIVGLVTATTLAITSRHNYIAARQARFEEFRSDGREIELQLEGVAEDVTKDVRFMSTLPPIQGIIQARAGTEESESEEVWRGRLETIYEGLLRANPNYLAVAFVGTSPDESKEIVRVERHATEQGYIRRIPASRLATVEQDATLLNQMLEMEPGDVKLVVGQSLLHGEGASAARRLVAALPIYDEQTGEIFGLTTIETNLTRQIERILHNLAERLGEIYVTDAQGFVWVTSHPSYGVESSPGSVRIADLVPEAADFFATSNILRHKSDEESFVVQRIQLDPADPTCNLGLVLRLGSSK